MGLDRRLYDAVKAGSVDLVRKYLAEGASPHAPVGKRKMTALDRAALGKHTEILALLRTAAAVEHFTLEGDGSNTFVQLRPKPHNGEYLLCYDEYGEPMDPRHVRMSQLAMCASSSLKRHDSFSPLGSLPAPAVQKGRRWEFERAKLRQIRKLGQGTFGVVFEGLAENIIPGEPSTRVAVKMLTEDGEDLRRNFTHEVKIMMAIDGPHHVVRLLGVCTDAPPLLMIMELMARGDLKTFLRASRPRPSQPSLLSLRQLASMGANVAEGMAYLASLNIVHRDLAARNCLVAEDLTVKVGDFGLTRDTEQGEYHRISGSAPLPIRWMSPEAIMDGVYSTYSDIWSFGIVLWELCSFAKMPYAGCSNSEICDMVCEENFRLRSPRGCPRELMTIMHGCWDEEPTRRGSFADIERALIAAAETVSADPIGHTVPGSRQGSKDMTEGDAEDGGDVRDGGNGRDGGEAAVEESAYVLDYDKDREQHLYVDERYAHLTSMDHALKVAKSEKLVGLIESEAPRAHTILRRAVAEDLRDAAEPGDAHPAPNPRNPAHGPAAPLQAPSPPVRPPVNATRRTQLPPVTAAAAAPRSSRAAAPRASSAHEHETDTRQTDMHRFAADSSLADSISAALLLSPSSPPPGPPGSGKLTRMVGGSTSRHVLANDESVTAGKVRRASSVAASRAEQEALAWLARVLARPLPESLHDTLRSGEVLCELMNMIAPGTIARVHSGSRMAFKQMENVGYFLDACYRFGVADADMFMTVDLFAAANMKQVVICLNALKHKAAEKGLHW